MKERRAQPAPPTGSVEEWTCTCGELLTPEGTCPACGTTLQQNTRLLELFQMSRPTDGTKH